MGRRYRIRPYADLPVLFLHLGNQGYMSLGTARASISIKETFEGVGAGSTRARLVCGGGVCDLTAAGNGVEACPAYHRHLVRR